MGDNLSSSSSIGCRRWVITREAIEGLSEGAFGASNGGPLLRWFSEGSHVVHVQYSIGSHVVQREGGRHT